MLEQSPFHTFKLLQHFVSRMPTSIDGVETVSDSLLNSNWRQEYRNAEKQIVRHVDTVMPCALRSVVIHIAMPCRTSEIPCKVLRVGFPLRDETCVKRRYYAILYTRVSVEGSEWGGRGLAGVVHEIPCADDIVAVSISIHGDALVEEVSLRYQPEFCGVRDDVLYFPIPIPARNLREEVAEFNDIPFLGIFAHVQTPPENLFNDSSFMLLEEFDYFALCVDSRINERKERTDFSLFRFSAGEADLCLRYLRFGKGKNFDALHERQKMSMIHGRVKVVPNEARRKLLKRSASHRMQSRLSLSIAETIYFRCLPNSLILCGISNYDIAITKTSFCDYLLLICYVRYFLIISEINHGSKLYKDVAIVDVFDFATAVCQFRSRQCIVADKVKNISEGFAFPLSLESRESQTRDTLPKMTS